HRFDLGESRLPESQDVLRHVEVVSHFTDGSESVGCLVQRPAPQTAACPYPIRRRRIIPVFNLMLLLTCVLGAIVVTAGFRQSSLAVTSCPLIRCLRSADGLKTIPRRGEIGTSVPVFGLRPMRCPFLRTMNEPNDDSFTVSPFSRQSVISFSTNSTN